MRRFFSVCALLMGSTAAVSAQVCLGAPSFASGVVRGGGGITFMDGAKVYGVELAAGLPQGLFGSGSVGRVDFDDISVGATAVSVNAGYAKSISTRAQFCPMATYEYMYGPNASDGSTSVRTRTHTAGLGGSLGGAIPVTPAFDVAPFASATYVHSRTTVRITDLGSEAQSDDYANLGVGLGLIVNRIFTVRPSVDFPVGLDGAKPNYTIAFGLNFGPRK